MILVNKLKLTHLNFSIILFKYINFFKYYNLIKKRTLKYEIDHPNNTPKLKINFKPEKVPKEERKSLF